MTQVKRAPHHLLHLRHLIHLLIGCTLQLMNDIATSDDHNYELTHFNWRTGAPYSVWVRVFNFSLAEPATRDYPGAPAELDARGWGSLGQPIELDDDDLFELANHIMNSESDFDDFDDRCFYAD